MLKDNAVKDALESWLRAQGQQNPRLNWLGELRAIDGDAGFRRYFRLQCGQVSLIAVYAPPEHENNNAFVDIAAFLLEQGVNVPSLVAHDFDLGFLLLEDLGETLYLDHLNADNASALYGEALFVLLRIQQSPTETGLFPAYDSELLLKEMQLFNDWFIGRLLGYELTSSESQVISDTFRVLIDSAVSQPQVIVHRDFHSRNIIFSRGKSPGIIDFQDAVVGPITYDVVSLLKDCYIAWPSELVERWALAYASMAVDVGLIEPVPQERFLKWFDFMGLQRHLKVLGIFSRLWLRDGKDRYLSDLPLVMLYVIESAAKYDETRMLGDWLEAAILPRAQQQPWHASP